MRNRWWKPILASVALMAASVLPAAAATIFYNSVSPTLDTERFSITCTLGCEGAWLDDYVLSTTYWDTGSGDLTDTANSNPGTELSVVNDFLALAGNNGDVFTSGTKTAAGGASSVVFISSAKYILLTVGKDPRVGLLWNTGGLNNKFTFSQTGKGAGFSHYTEYGGTTTSQSGIVPLPAGGLFLLTGLGGLIVLRRRRKSV